MPPFIPPPTETRINLCFQYSSSRKVNYIKIKTFFCIQIFGIIKNIYIYIWFYSSRAWVLCLIVFQSHIKQHDYQAHVWLLCLYFSSGEIIFFSLHFTSAFICQKPKKNAFNDWTSEWDTCFSLVWTLAQERKFNTFTWGRFPRTLMLECHCKVTVLMESHQ